MDMLLRVAPATENMTLEALESRSQQLETRVETLESELASVKEILSRSSQKEVPWWLKVTGSSQQDPNFDEVVRLGQEWRKSAE